MRFIVDLYRLLVLAAIAAALIVGAFVVFTVVLRDGSGELGGLVAAGMIAGAIFLVLSIGLIAIVISMHDRMVDIADQSRRIADGLERRAGYERDAE